MNGFSRKQAVRRLLVALFTAIGVLASSDSNSANKVLGQETTRSEAPTSGDRLMQTVASHVAQYESVDAKVRYKARLFGVDLIGSGVYLQQGRQTEPDQESPLRSRLELKTQTRGGANSLLEVNTGSYLYRQRRVGETPTADRIDLRRVRREWETYEGSRDGSGFAPPMQALAMGGLPKLVTSLSLSFQFNEARSVQLARNVPGFEVVGHWRREKLAELAPSQRERILSGEGVDWSQLPGHLPQEVAITVGRNDLFPYVFEYRRFDADEAGHESKSEKGEAPGEQGETPTPTATNSQQIVLFQILKVVTNGPIDEAQFRFRYDPNVYVPDRTEEFLPRKAQ